MGFPVSLFTKSRGMWHQKIPGSEDGYGERPAYREPVRLKILVWRDRRTIINEVGDVIPIQWTILIEDQRPEQGDKIVFEGNEIVLGPTSTDNIWPWKRGNNKFVGRWFYA